MGTPESEAVFDKLPNAVSDWLLKSDGKPDDKTDGKIVSQASSRAVETLIRANILAGWGLRNFILNNPNALSWRVYVHAPGTVRAVLRFERDGEGAPGHAHGGAIAAWLDQLMGLHVGKLGHRAVTATLNVRYIRAIGLKETLISESTLVRMTGRKFYLSAWIKLADGRVAAEADGLFVNVERNAKL